MILLRLFCANLPSALGLATTVVDPLALPSCLVLLEVRRSCLRCRCSAAPTPPLLMDPSLALVSISYVLRLGCRTGWACRLTLIVRAGKGRCVRRACALYVCESPNSCAQRLPLIGCVTSSCIARASGLRVDDMVLRGGSMCGCAATSDTLIRDHCDSQW